MSRSRLEATDMRRVSHGVIVSPNAHAPESLLDRCVQLLPILRPHHFISRRTASQIHGLPVSPPQRIEVASRWPHRAPQRDEILGHRIRTSNIRVIERKGVQIASPVDAWCQLAPVCSVQDLVIAGDALLTPKLMVGGGRRHTALATIEDLHEAVTRYRSSHGASIRKQALKLLRYPVDSPAETLTRLLIVRAGLPEPVVQCPVPVHGRILHADLGYPEQRIAIEYEGRYHFEGGVEQARFDVERWELMHEAGWRVLRVTARDLRSPDGFLRRLVLALDTRSSHA